MINFHVPINTLQQLSPRGQSCFLFDKIFIANVFYFLPEGNVFLFHQPLGRLGASVIGIDPVEENIKTAQRHKSFDPVLDKRIEYRACSLEEIVEETAETFDGVVASEVVEHVIDLETFIQCCYQVLKVRLWEFTCLVFLFRLCMYSQQ